jgi:2-dehydropantoate 2-reductase
MREVLAVAQGRGIQLSEAVVEGATTFMDSLPADATASMQRDMIAGLPSELESQNGAVVRLGREVGIPTPIHDLIYSCLLPQELKARGEVEF